MMMQYNLYCYMYLRVIASLRVLSFYLSLSLNLMVWEGCPSKFCRYATFITAKFMAVAYAGLLLCLMFLCWLWFVMMIFCESHRINLSIYSDLNE